MRKLIDFLVEGEGLRLRAYQCPAGVWTIGIGNTYYRDGKPVKQGDRISVDDAYALAEVVVLDFIQHVKKSVKHELTENQFIALVSFCYNIGKAAFTKSVILKMVNANPNDPAIRQMFEKSFVTAAGKPCKGLVNRRRSEANLYFKKIA
jgi:lysozyme